MVTVGVLAVVLALPLVASAGSLPPGGTFTDDDDNIDQVGAFLADLPAVPAVEVLPYHPSARHKYRSLALKCAVEDIQPPSAEDVRRALARLSGYGLQVLTGG